MRRTVLVGMLMAAMLVVPAVPARAADGLLPLAGAVVRGFDPPAQRWLAGHRGVDLAAPPGTAVLSPADGVVTFAGMVAGRMVLVVSHGELRSTLEPVEPTVTVGQAVRRGDVIGHLLAGHACSAEACLHWGLRRGEAYLDPLSLIGADEVLLLPDSAVDAVRARAADREAAARAAMSAAGTIGGSGVLALPTDGRLTSPFGPRFHPIFHEWRLHAGIDLSAACGTPIRAAADGVVTHVGFDASGGWRLILGHPGIGAVQTVYLHAQGYRVRSGERVSRGQVVGTVGTTGWSTGCHLHFSVKVNGQHVDPQTWL